MEVSGNTGKSFGQNTCVIGVQQLVEIDSWKCSRTAWIIEPGVNIVKQHVHVPNSSKLVQPCEKLVSAHDLKHRLLVNDLYYSKNFIGNFHFQKIWTILSWIMYSFFSKSRKIRSNFSWPCSTTSVIRRQNNGSIVDLAAQELSRVELMWPSNPKANLHRI